MFSKLSVDTSYEPFYRNLTKHKSIKVLAKIDGEHWYDISKFVKKVTVNNQIQLLDTPTIDTAKLTVKNDNNAFTSTVYNDEFNPSAGKLNGTVEQGYLNKVWEIQVYTTVSNGTSTIDIPIFHGWKPNQAITEKHNEAEIELKDMLWITTQKRLKNPLLYTSMTPSAIIADLLSRCGLDTSYQDLQALNTTFDVFIAEQDKSYWQIIQNICEATAGIISTTPDGKILYRTRIESFTDPEIALSISQDSFSKYNLEQKPKFNQLKVESEGYEISDSTNDLLVDTTLTGDAAIIKAGQTQNFEFEYTSEFAKDFADTVFITVMLGDTIVDNLGAFSEGDSDGYIRVNRLIPYPDKLVLNITNLASTVDYTIAQVRFRGRQIKKLSLNTVEEPNITDEPDNEISIKSFYSDTSILSNILDALKFNINKDIVFKLTLNEFYPDIFAGNLINFNIPLKGIAVGTFIIEQIKHVINDDLSYNTELVLSEWKDIIFDIGTKEIYKSTPVDVITESSNQSQIEEIVGSISELQTDMEEQQSITSYLDGRAPDTPTGLIVTTEVINRESVLKVSFNPNSETDLLGYEIAYSQDSIWWQYITTAETSVYIQVIGNTQYFVKVRAFDAEGKKSAWTVTQSILSAKDTIPPAIPTGLTVEPLFQKIVVKWAENTEPDLSKYKVEVSLDNFATVLDTIYTDSNYVVYGGNTNTTYYFRVSAIDLSENESGYSMIVSGTTVAVYDADIESAILDGLAADMNELNTVTLPNLQTQLNSKLDDLPNEITETHIANNSISSPKIQTNAITADKILANAVTSTKIAASAITAEKIGANQIITNSANIANGIIDTVHIRDAAIQTAKIKDAAVTNAKIANLAVDDAKIANIDAAKITSGYIDADRIQAGSITGEKLVIQPPDALPNGTIAYWTNSLTDEINGIAFAGIEEQHLNNSITLTPENAPEGSIVGELLAADKIYANHIASNFTISAGQYIQAGTADRNYKLDGTQGLIRTIGTNTYNIFSYVTDGFVTFDGTTMSTFISLADFDLTDYTVILVQSSAYNDSYEANKYVMCDWEKGTSGFTIYFHSFVPSETLTSSAASVNLTKDRTGEWSGWYNLGTTSANCIYLTVATFFHKKNGTTTSTGSSHQYRFAHSYNIKLREKAVYINELNVTWTSEIDWGDGTFSQHSLVFSTYVFDILIDNVYAKQEIYREMTNRIGRLGIIGYSVLGY